MVMHLADVLPCIYWQLSAISLTFGTEKVLWKKTPPLQQAAVDRQNAFNPLTLQIASCYLCIL